MNKINWHAVREVGLCLVAFVLVMVLYASTAHAGLLLS